MATRARAAAGTRLRICDAAAHGEPPLFTRVDLDGGVSLLDADQALPQPEEHSPLLEPHAPGRPLLSRFEGMRQAGYMGASTRIGGIPAWEQDAEVPVSPLSGKPMTFIAQFPHPTDGTASLFLDYDNLIATVVTQWD